MKKLYLKILFFISLFALVQANASQSNYFEQGLDSYKKENFEDSKILFEKDIVFNPKNEKSYLYLAKIFNKNDNDISQEVNLNSVLLLDPQNEEAIYMLALLKIKQSNYNKSQELIEKFALVCNTFCSKKSEMQKKLNTIAPENEKSNN